MAHSEVVATDVEELCTLNKLPDLLALQMLKVVVVGSAQLSDHASVMASDDNTTATGRLLCINTVLNVHTGLLDCLVKRLGILIVTNTTEEDDAILWEKVLCATGGVLGSAAGNELSIEVVQEIIEETCVLFLSKDGVVGLDAVLLKESGIPDC